MTDRLAVDVMLPEGPLEPWQFGTAFGLAIEKLLDRPEVNGLDTLTASVEQSGWGFLSLHVEVNA